MRDKLEYSGDLSNVTTKPNPMDDMDPELLSLYSQLTVHHEFYIPPREQQEREKRFGKQQNKRQFSALT